jgi:folylpolyglutamate synthase/dihydropteroate synthase
MLAALGGGVVVRLIGCRPFSPRALDPRAVADAAIDLGLKPDQVNVFEKVPAALARALAVTAPNGQVVVAGSLYLAGEARGVLVR